MFKIRKLSKFNKKMKLFFNKNVSTNFIIIKKFSRIMDNNTTQAKKPRTNGKMTQITGFGECFIIIQKTKDYIFQKK